MLYVCVSADPQPVTLMAGSCRPWRLQFQQAADVIPAARSPAARLHPVHRSPEGRGSGQEGNPPTPAPDLGLHAAAGAPVSADLPSGLSC